MTAEEARLTGTTALVTGATSGLGRAVALRLAAAGADVALLGRSERDLAQAAAEVEGHGVRALPLPVDLADTGTLGGVVDRVADELGGLGVLVNAAATDAPGTAEEVPLDDWERVLAVNLTAPFALARAAMPHMRRGGGGLVVNVSSVAGRRGWAKASAYCSTKFALTGLTQSLAAEGRADGIRACVLYPGAMSTSWGTFDPAERASAEDREHDERESLDPAVVADLIAWMALSPGRPVLNEVTVTPLLEGGWP
ncbi:short-subunit dehydrogenase [Kineococcus xinjiangensis]|uniref:Short-subunit dehydrogenase n=1 Tax=Kineococcus xinjiangensis TaxID=512762 RepID=A0A2S6IC50_9ACTN|nr:SDR family NAD(P)-dependent oxidoreductase [Kineococcus xinjiangensis]PPK90808.1 short-subunit dehydrogenase [Kineococcus xinjiangensis]